MQNNLDNYERKITPFESMLSYSPFSIVTVVARINGNVTLEMLRNAVEKAQQRHTNLRVRIKIDPEHNKWFTTENVGDIPVELDWDITDYFHLRASVSLITLSLF